jgi:SpoVK/Ycf46/Vps4 family AAA+-type ATPase
MQGFEKNKNILLVIAATNRPWHIDSALLRPGRLDSLIYVDLPNKEARNLMFNRYLSKINVEEDIIEYLAGYTDGYNGSDIKAVCDYLIRIVINKEIEKIKDYEITFEDCVSVLKEFKSSVTIKDIENMSYFINTYKIRGGDYERK